MGVLSFPNRDRRSEEQPNDENAGRSIGARLVRGVLITAAVVAVVYAVVRVLRGDDESAIGELSGRGADEMSEIAIEGSTDGESREWAVVDDLVDEDDTDDEDGTTAESDGTDDEES